MEVGKWSLVQPIPTRALLAARDPRPLAQEEIELLELQLGAAKESKKGPATQKLIDAYTAKEKRVPFLLLAREEHACPFRKRQAVWVFYQRSEGLQDVYVAGYI